MVLTKKATTSIYEKTEVVYPSPGVYGKTISSIGGFAGKQIDKVTTAGVGIAEKQSGAISGLTGGLSKAISSPLTWLAIAAAGVAVLVIVK